MILNTVHDIEDTTHTSNAKCFRNVTLINIRGFLVIIVPVIGYGRLSPNQAVIKRECSTDEVLLSLGPRQYTIIDFNEVDIRIYLPE